MMLLVVPVRPNRIAEIPAVCHAGTARLQMVDRGSNPLYYQLIESFAELTGVPMLLNTSFNLRGEPIVSSPGDALGTFRASGLDLLVIGRHMVRKAAPC